MCKVGENRKCTEWPQTGLEDFTVKRTLYIDSILIPEAQILVRFALRLAVSEIQGLQKSEMHRVTPNWTWTLNSQKYSIYTKYLPLRSKFWSVSLYEQWFPRYRTFYNSPLTAMLNVPKKNNKKKKKKKPKIQNSKFHNSLYNFGRHPSQEHAWIFGRNTKQGLRI